MAGNYVEIEKDTLWFAVIVVLGIGLVCGGLLGIWFGESMQRQAIEHNCAQYHPQTGEFHWRGE